MLLWVVLQLILPHQVDHTHLWPSQYLCRLLGPHGLILYFDVPRSSLKNTCLLLYVTFKSILTCTREFWPQTRIHQDVCISQNIFGVFLIWVRLNWLLAFQIPWECLDLTLHYLFGVLYKEPLIGSWNDPFLPHLLYPFCLFLPHSMHQTDVLFSHWALNLHRYD